MPTRTRFVQKVNLVQMSIKFKRIKRLFNLFQTLHGQIEVEQMHGANLINKSWEKTIFHNLSFKHSNIYMFMHYGSRLTGIRDKRLLNLVVFLFVWREGSLLYGVDLYFTCQHKSYDCKLFCHSYITTLHIDIICV